METNDLKCKYTCAQMYQSKYKTFCTSIIIFQSFLIIFTIYTISVIYDKRNYFENVNSATPETEQFYKFQKFWTNTGFCPLGDDVSKYLLNDDIRLHLNLIGALSNFGINTIRIHWLLDLIDVKFTSDDNYTTQYYDFTKLDSFIDWIDEAGLYLGFEFMGNPGNIFSNKTDNYKTLVWEDLSTKISQRYLKKYGQKKLLKWRFETWNEPDLKNYNRINFTTDNYLAYAIALHNGLKFTDEKLRLRGPAGLFKNQKKHPLCWKSLEFCNQYVNNCPFEVISFHRKGNGNSSEVAYGGKTLLTELFSEFPKLSNFAVSNDEADPISGWSTPREFQSDINYAVDLIRIVLEHWSMKLNSNEFSRLESISHDNAFMSYHPYEFTQRTLFARFQMNNSNPVYSQFIAKPVYIALGMLGYLGDFAKDAIFENNLSYLTTTTATQENFYLAIIATSTTQITSELSDDGKTQLSFSILLPEIPDNQKFALCVQALETNDTNPIELWNSYGRPPYPTKNEREWMRRVQGPETLESRYILQDEKIINIKYSLNAPWVGLIRICSLKENEKLSKPENIRFLKIKKGEVMIFWDQQKNSNNCIKTFEIKFKPKKRNQLNAVGKDKSWKFISRGWRVPFRYFQFAPENQYLTGGYMVRAVYLDGKTASEFSEIAYYEEE